jgi:hypothetical protein
MSVGKVRAPIGGLVLSGRVSLALIDGLLVVKTIHYRISCQAEHDLLLDCAGEKP